MGEPNESMNQAVLNSLPAHIAVLDAQGNIIATNEAWDRFARANGAPTLEGCGVGSNYLSACEAADPGAGEIAQGVRDVLAGRRSEFTTEYPCHAPDEERWFLLTVTPLAGSGRGAVVSHFNITDRKRSEESLRLRALELQALARSLQRTNDELDQFAYITSHDLRAPLRGIANLSQWIEEDMGERFTPEAHQQMELLRGRVHRMEALIDGILEYSRIGRVRAEPEEVDVAALLAEVIDLLDVPPQFTIEVAPNMPTLMGEKLRLQQVFQNLIGNAIKYHDKPSGRISIDCRDAGPFVKFSVTDDGPGIDPKYHDKIFVIFQTLQPRDQVESTGVGLSLVKKIVEGFGGRISVESEPGKGATFRFTWPRRVDGLKRAPRQTARGEQGESITEGPTPWKTAG